jgi:hypothetical protein
MCLIVANGKVFAIRTERHAVDPRLFFARVFDEDTETNIKWNTKTGNKREADQAFSLVSKL